MSSSGMSDSETASQSVQGASFAAGNFTTMLLPPILDIPPPAPLSKGGKDVVTYSKEVQTAIWVPEENNEEDGEEVVKRRVDEEVRKEMEQLRVEEERKREVEALRLEAEKEVPGNPPKAWN
jgi:hypothetical protein